MGFRRRVNQEEVLRKKVFACRVKVKRAIKKSKDFETRKIVRRLKQAKEGSEENLVEQLKKDLQEAKETKIEAIVNIIDNVSGGGDRSLLEDRIIKSKAVQEQLLDLGNLQEKLQRAIDTHLAENDVVKTTADLKLTEEKDVTGCSTRTNAGKSRETEKDLKSESPHVPKEMAKKKLKSKNRMGQRARRKLARQQGKPDNRFSSKLKAKVAPESLKNISIKKTSGRINDNANLHPSWIAKKELANAVRESLNCKPAGQKIVFNDN